MKRILLMLILIVALLMAACSAPVMEPEETPAPLPTEATTPEPEPEPIPTETPWPKDISFTTGLPFFEDYKPVMAVIENSPAARPQTGLQTADIVYEVPVEGRVTRLVCIFSDNVPEKIMPVRSARPPFLYLQSEWNSVFMHYGGSGPEERDWVQPYSIYGHHLYAPIKDKYAVDGLKGKWNKYYKRVSGVKAPHNVEGNALLAQDLYDYEPEPLYWRFDASVDYPGSTVSEISLKMASGTSDFVSYTYDADEDVYLRFMSGKPFKSAETKEQVSVKNIVVQYSSYEAVQGIKLWNMVGKGNADFYIGGKLVKGSWERESEDTKTVFYDSAGDQIVFRPGNTWVHLHPNP